MNGFDKQEETNRQSQIPWAQARSEDVITVDVDSFLPFDHPADWHSLSDFFRSKAKADQENPEQLSVLRMLSGLLSMTLEPGNAAVPFRPFLIFPDGRRSAAIEDFRSATDALAALAGRSKHPAIVSRAADVCWILERRRHDMGLTALSAYIRLLDGISAGDLRFDNEPERDIGDLGIRALRRCMTIARSRSFGDRSPDVEPISTRIERLRLQELTSDHIDYHLSLATIQRDFDLKDPSVLARDVETSVAKLAPGADGYAIVHALEFAAKSYRRAKDEGRAQSVKKQISQVYVAMADSQAHSAILTSRLLADAISALAGVQGVRETRLALQHRLVDVQVGIADEMGVFSHPMQLDELSSEVSKNIEGLSFYDALFMFATMAQSPHPDKIRNSAREEANENPLSSIFEASFHDLGGKVRHISAAYQPNNSEDSSLDGIISRREYARRAIYVAALDIARQHLCLNFYVYPDLLLPLLSRSPFVPKGQELTFAIGLTNFIRGDATSALYILTPQVESGVRACLKARGYDVTTFDDSTQTQEDKTLSALYRDHRKELEDVFGPARVFDLEQVFLAPAGPALRHGVAHGLLNDGDPLSPESFYACWLVLHICLVPLYRIRADLDLPKVKN